MQVFCGCPVARMDVLNNCNHWAPTIQLHRNLVGQLIIQVWSIAYIANQSTFDFVIPIHLQDQNCNQLHEYDKVKVFGLHYKLLTILVSKIDRYLYLKLPLMILKKYT
jgi:hypothetical protein